MPPYPLSRRLQWQALELNTSRTLPARTESGQNPGTSKPPASSLEERCRALNDPDRDRNRLLEHWGYLPSRDELRQAWRDASTPGARQLAFFDEVAAGRRTDGVRWWDAIPDYAGVPDHVRPADHRRRPATPADLVAEAHRAHIRRLCSSGPHRRRHAIWWTGTFDTHAWCEHCGFMGPVHGPGSSEDWYRELHVKGCPYARWPLRRSSRVVGPTLGRCRSAGTDLAEWLASERIPARIRSEQGLAGGRWHLHGLVWPVSRSEHIRAERGLMNHARDHGFVYARRVRGAGAELAYLEKHETRLAGSRRSEFWPTWLVTKQGDIHLGL